MTNKLVGKVKLIKLFYIEKEAIFKSNYLILKINEFEKRIHHVFYLV